MKSSFQDIITQDVPVLVDFYADWCGPCKTIYPMYKKLSDNNKNIVFLSCDIDEAEHGKLFIVQVHSNGKNSIQQLTIN